MTREAAAGQQQERSGPQLHLGRHETVTVSERRQLQRLQLIAPPAAAQPAPQHATSLAQRLARLLAASDVVAEQRWLTHKRSARQAGHSS